MKPLLKLLAHISSKSHALDICNSRHISPATHAVHKDAASLVCGHLITQMLVMFAAS